jgi:DNA polymerase
LRFCLIDFETASACDLKRAGAWRYAEDPTTEILCLGYTIDGGEGRVLTPSELVQSALNSSPSDELCYAAYDPACIFVAHNAQFEKVIWRNIMVAQLGWPDIPNDRWHDIMAVCAMKGLPLRLERAILALGLPSQKDKEGSRVTIALSRPDRKGNYNRTPEKLARVYEYNRSDLVAELALHRRVRGLSQSEREVWLLDQRINERGVCLDLNFADACQKIVDDASKPLIREFEKLTGVRPTQRDKFLEWLHTAGCNIENLQKETIAKYLNTEDEDDSLAGDEDDYTIGPEQITLPFHFERALSIRQILGSASIKKLGAMRSCACADGRARGLLQYHGAGPGRWAGRLFQPQNFPRPSLKVDGEAPDQGHLVETLMTGDYQYVESLYGEAINVVANGLRHALIPSEGNAFAVGDFAKIECVIVLALAGATETAANVIKMGSAVYTDMATKIFGYPVTKKMLKEYTIGKNSVLGCGFQMGWKKFKTRYWQNASEDDAKEAIRIYREDFAPEVPRLWRDLERAAVDTVWSKQAHMAWGVTYALEDGWLTARLPSGRKLWYFDPRPVRKPMPWDHTDVRPGFEYSAWKMGQWKRISAYGGLLTENVVQALARDLLVAALFRCEANNYPIVLTVHDEAVADLPAYEADAKMLEQIMCERPDWARALQIPVAADCWIGDRYRK